MTFPSNAYTTKLPNMMELDGDWEVGLVAISCPGALINVHGDEYVFRVINHAGNYAKVYTLKEGYYRDVYDFVDAANDLLRVLRERNDILRETIGIERQKAYLRFVELEKVVELVIRPGYKVYFNEALARKLGFPHHAVYTGQTMGVAPEANGAIVRSLYVYCDLLETVPLGDAKVPLLHIVNMSERRDHANMHQTMKRVLFMPVQKKHFDTIEIQILDDRGSIVPFEDGKSVVLLEFRRVRHPYFFGKA